MFNWQGAVKVYMDALENPSSTPYARECAREDIMVRAKIVDTLKEKFGKNISIDDLHIKNK